MLIHPNINPVPIKIGAIQIHWYGIMYLLAFGLAWLLGQWRASHSNGQWSKERVTDLIFYCVIGVILGGRLGYMLFYSLPTLFADPISIIKIWQGGMSFHGGLLGVLVSMWWFGKRHQKTFFEVSDFTAPLVPLGIAAGRLGNFINSELWGKVTTVSWGMVFPTAGALPRHPSQLYELFLEGLVLFSMVWIFSSRKRPPMAVSGLFALGYGLFRFFLEFYRVPDAQYGYLAWGWLTMGQVLSVPLIVVGIVLLSWAYCRPSRVWCHS